MVDADFSIPDILLSWQCHCLPPLTLLMANWRAEPKKYDKKWVSRILVHLLGSAIVCLLY
jgi:hypothetical protein